MVVVMKTKKAKAGKVSIQTGKTNPKAKVTVSTTSNETLELEEEILEDYEQEVEGLPEKEFTQPVANVGFSAGVTKNLGDYNSLKIQVSLHLPCYVHEVNETFDYAKSFVDAKVNDVLDEYGLAE